MYDVNFSEESNDDVTVGFIGGGALTESVIKGIRGNFLPSSDIFVSDHKQKRCKELSNRYRVKATVGFEDFIEKVNLLIIAVKPKDIVATLSELKEKVNLNTTILSVVAGLKIEVLEKIFPRNAIVRAMPNVALSVGEGMTAYAMNKKALAADRDLINKFWSSIGRALEVDERVMDAVTGLSGSGSAYAFLMIDALADGGVAAGLNRAAAIELAAQTLLGAAKMILETGEHPAALRDKVTSPAGTTIEGIRVLERGGVRSALIEAVVAATEKSRNLGK